MNEHKVELTYFKSSGKYYSDGTYNSTKQHVHEIFQEVGEMLAQGKRPGLCDGYDHFYVLIQLPDHANGFPALHVPSHMRGLMPERERKFDSLSDARDGDKIKAIAWNEFIIVGVGKITGHHPPSGLYRVEMEGGRLQYLFDHEFEVTE